MFFHIVFIFSCLLSLRATQTGTDRKMDTQTHKQTHTKDRHTSRAPAVARAWPLAIPKEKPFAKTLEEAARCESGAHALNRIELIELDINYPSYQMVYENNIPNLQQYTNEQNIDTAIKR